MFSRRRKVRIVRSVEAHSRTYDDPALADDIEWDEPEFETPPPPRKQRCARRKRRPPSLLYRVANLALMAFAGLVVIVVTGIGILATGLPSSDEYLALKGTPNVTFLDIHGRVVARRGAGQGALVKLAELPPYLTQAVLATEDRRFYDHWGVDLSAIARAMLANVEAGRVVQGGSTITQQLAKNLFLESDRTMLRKAQEMLLALYLEMRFTKDEILEMYLNRAYFGAGAYGVDAAARRYFGKPASNVSLAEAAILAGLLKAPSRYSPANDFDLAAERSRLVLDAMVEEGYLAREKAGRAAATRPKLAMNQASPGVSYFVDWVMSDVPGFIGGLTQDLVVETTLDSAMQRAAETAITAALAREGRDKNVHEGALIALSPDGAVRALVGGKSYAHSQFDRAIQARRQPGSAFKPFVYLTALEAGWTPNSRVLDAPVQMANWAPDNFESEFEGEVTLTRALSRSLNSAAVRLIRALGARKVAATARRLGIVSRLDVNASLALGTSDVTLSELTSAYAAFANGGYGVVPFVIRRIKTASGRVLYERDAENLGRVVAPEHVAGINAMLFETLLSGTGKSARLAGRPAAGKTGTSQNFRDAWFVGYTPELIAGVWMGNDDGAAMDRVTGGTIPARAWHDFMTAALEGVPASPLPGTGEIPVLEPFVPMEPGAENEEANAFDRLLDAITSEIGPAPAAASN